ncbi:MAG: helix-turn-helix domain-containing protein [Nitrospira sp.]|nr:helix-turn-helix domain-containing protein [Nitrospira sp.]
MKRVITHAATGRKHTAMGGEHGRGLYSVEEAARILKVDQQWVYMLLWKRRLQGFKKHGCWRIPGWALHRVIRIRNTGQQDTRKHTDGLELRHSDVGQTDSRGGAARFE